MKNVQRSSEVCQTDRSTLKPNSLASVKVNYWKLAVRQGVKLPSPITCLLLIPELPQVPQLGSGTNVRIIEVSTAFFYTQDLQNTKCFVDPWLRCYSRSEYYP